MNISELEQLRINMVESKKQFDDSFVGLATKLSGHKVGDTIVVNGYSHRGKDIIVDNIYGKFDNWKKEYFAVLQGYVLKNNGEVSKNRAETTVSIGIIN